MTPAQRHMELVARAGCCLGNRRLHVCEGRFHVHHIATGSGKRSDFSTACLCWSGHEGPAGIHGMGTKAFLRLYGLSSEYDLLVMANEDIAKLRVREKPA